MSDPLTDAEIKALRGLLHGKPILDKIVKKEEAWTLVGSTMKSVALWLAAMSAGAYVLWNSFHHLVKSALKQ